MIDETHIKNLTTYLENRNYSPNTIKNYLVTIRKFLNDVNKKPKDITIQDFEEEVNRMLTSRNTGRWGKGTPQRYGVNSLTTKYMALKMYILFLNEQIHHTYEEENYKLKYNPKKFLHPPPHVLPDKEALTKEEVSRIFKVAESNKRDYAILKTLYYSTQRRTTVQMLNISDINFNTNRIEYKHGLKGKMGEKKPHYNYPQDALPSIQDYLQNGREKPNPGNENALFLNGLGERICNDTINRVVKKYAVLTGITKHVTPHIFRRTAITIMDSEGMTRDAIMQVTGQRQIKTLDTYIRPDKTECNKKSHIALSLDTTTKTPPQPTPQPEKKPESPKPHPQDSYIAKTPKQKLTERFINGEISESAYVTALNNLDESYNTFYG
jgi:integrase/recombinase XerD